MKRGIWILVAFLVLCGSVFLFKPTESERTAPANHSTPPARPTKNIRATGESAPTVSSEVPASAEEGADNLEDPTGELRTLEVAVFDEQSRPVVEAEVRVRMILEPGATSRADLNRTILTEPHGIAHVQWPASGLRKLELLAVKEDHAPRKMIWDTKAGDKIPATHTFTLAAGLRLSGVIVDEQDQPLGGVEVSMTRSWSRDEDAPISRGEETTFPRTTVKTDAQGRWTMANVPPKFLEKLSAMATLSGYITTNIHLRSPEAEKELLAGTHKTVLTRGLGISGRVVNEQDQPISRATVWAGRRFSHNRQDTLTDDRGHFAFDNVERGKVRFSAMADGYAPISVSREIGAEPQEIVLRLEKGSVVFGIVQNEANEPIAGVHVALEGNSGDPAYDGYEFTQTTREDGRFEWKGGPNKPVRFYFGKQGYLQQRGNRLKPNEENIVTLKRSAEIHGRVVDANSGAVVTNFSVALGQLNDGSFHSMFSGSTKTFTSDTGSFTLIPTEESDSAIQASAKGYAETAMKLPTPKDGKVEVTLKLKPAESIQGIVVTPDGKRPPGVTVAVAEDMFRGRSVKLERKGLTSYGRKSAIVTTDAQGVFQIPSPPESGFIVAAGELGYGSATLEEIKASGRLVLQLYGRIEGTLAVPSTAGQQMILSDSTGAMQFDFEEYRTSVDENGKFIFENVPPGVVHVLRGVKTGPTSTAHSHKTRVEVEPGQTSYITLGGTDATVSGTVQFPNPPTEPFAIVVRLNSVLPTPPDGITPEEREAFYKSPEWKQVQQQSKSFAAVAGPDGTFSVDSVPPGDYTLWLRAQKTDSDSFGERPLAESQTKISVPAGATPSTPVNFGQFVLERRK